MKKVLVIGLALILALSLMGCGKSKPATEVDQLISNIGEVTLESEEAIIEAEEYYDTLTEGQRDEVENYKVLVDARKAYDKLVEESEPALGTWKATEAVVDGQVISIETLEQNSDEDHDPNVSVIMDADNTITLNLGKDITVHGTWTKERSIDNKSWFYNSEGLDDDIDIYCKMNDDNPDELFLFFASDNDRDIMYAMKRDN